MFEDLLSSQQLKSIVLPLGIILVGLVVGLILDRIMVKKISNAIRKYGVHGMEGFEKSLGHYPFYLALFIGAYIATYSVSNISEELIINIQQVIRISLMFLTTVLLARISSLVVNFGISRAYGDQQASSLFINIAKVLVYIIGLLIIFQTLGIDVTALITALGVGGLAVALALQDTLANLFAGVYIIAARKISKGDFIQLDSGEQGFVEDVSWRNTTIRHLQNYSIIIPNAKIGSAILSNFNLPVKEISVLVNCSVSYDSDLEKVETIVVEVAKKIMKEVSGGVPENEPFVRFNEFGDSGVGFTTIMRGQFFTDQYLLKHEFIKKLHKRFREEGIEIPYPKLDVSLKK